MKFSSFLLLSLVLMLRLATYEAYSSQASALEEVDNQKKPHSTSLPKINQDQSAEENKKSMPTKPTIKNDIKIFKTQEEFNAHCAQTIIDIYKTMNQNVGFSDASQTESKFWNHQTLLGKTFFVKKRGALLSEAINDLIQQSSKTRFSCLEAFLIARWKILSDFGADNIISQIEKENAGFLFPLISEPIFSSLENYAISYGFQQRTDAFRVGKASVQTDKEWEKIKGFRLSLKKLTLFEKSTALVPQNKVDDLQPYQPPQTVLGGMLYLPNAPGVTGIGKGENLYYVDTEKKLYYGFGPLYETGPLPLLKIAQDLQKYADNNLPGPEGAYIRAIMPHMQKLQQLGFKKVPEDRHALEYFVDPNTCCYFSLRFLQNLQQKHY